MRTTLLLLTLSLAAASFAALPSAEAGPACPQVGGMCVIDLVLDPCAYQSDCCPSSSFWCPEDS